MSLVLGWRELLVLLLLAIVVYVGEWWWFMRKLGEREHLGSGGTAADARLERLSAELSQTRMDLQRLQTEVDKLRQGREGSILYGEAIRMAQQGMTPGEIADACGISRSEAELIAALHRDETR